MNNESVKTESQAGFLCDRLYTKLAGLGTWGVGAFNAWQLKHDRDSLEVELARIIETANSHKAKGRLPNGAPVYQALMDRATAKITAFCLKWKYEQSEIYAQIPALHDLTALTVAGRNTPPGLMLLAALLGSLAVLFTLGIASGIIQAGNHWTLHMLVR